MLSLKERIELLENDLKQNPPAFTMTADLPFAIFRYDPSLPDENEWRMRREIEHLRIRISNATNREVHILPLSRLFWQSIEKSEGIETIVGLERDESFEAARSQVSDYLSDPDWKPLPKLLADATAHMDRVSSLLEQLMGETKIPAVLFYPGTWKGTLNYMNLKNDEQPMGNYRVKIYGRDS